MEAECGTNKASSLVENLLGKVGGANKRQGNLRRPESPSTLSASVNTGVRSVDDTDGCLNRVPKNRLTFLAQIIVVYGIISVSVYHLSVQSPNQELWLVLLSSAFGYILPSPGLKYLKRPKVSEETGTVSRPALDTDSVDAAHDEETGCRSNGFRGDGN